MLVDFRQKFSTMSLAWLLEFAVFYLAALTAYRVLMTWVYSNTHSLPLAMLMHASCTGWLVALYPATSFEQGLLWQTALAVALGLAVAVVMMRFEHGEAPRASQMPGNVGGQGPPDEAALPGRWSNTRRGKCRRRRSPWQITEEVLLVRQRTDS